MAISVKDTGEGMEYSQLEHLFHPVTQQDASDTRRHGGAGLGLSICRQLATMMGGKASFRSRPGQGSGFTFTLPIQHCMQTSTAGTASTGIGPAATATAQIRQWDKAGNRRPAAIIALSANVTTDDVKKSLLAGCNFHLSKPVHKSVLLDRINEALVNCAG